MNFQFSRKIVSLFAGFSSVGIITTIISIVAIYFFLEVIGTPLYITYALIYFFTICLSYFLNTIFVFKSSVTWKKATGYFSIYLSGMLIGMMVLWLLEKTLPVENYILAYLVIPVTMTWNFILSFFLFKK